MNSRSNSRTGGMRGLRWHLFAGLASLLVSGHAAATAITYEVTQLDGDTWRYDYTLDNDTLGSTLGEFTVYFGLGDYFNLDALITPAGWTGFIAQPDPLLPDDGFFDLLATNGGIPAGQSLGGFSIVFDWLASGTPGSQRFDIIEPESFTTLESGLTIRASASTSVPEPSSLLLLIAGLVTISWMQRRRACTQGDAHV